MNLWSTIVQTASAAISALSLSAAIYVIARDKVIARRTEPAKVLAWARMTIRTSLPSGERRASGLIHIQNRAEFLVFTPAVVFRTMTKREVRAYQRELGLPFKDAIDAVKELRYGAGAARPEGAGSPDEEVVLDPGEDRNFEMSSVDGISIEHIQYWLYFRDHTGALWLRSIDTHQMYPATSRLARKEVRGRTVWLSYERTFWSTLGLPIGRTSGALMYAWEVLRTGTRPRLD